MGKSKCLSEFLKKIFFTTKEVTAVSLKELVKMKKEKIETDDGRICGTWKPFTIFIVVLLIATQFLILLNMRNSYIESREKNKSDKPVYEPSVKLKPLRLDKARFEIEVVKPHKVMRTKFHDHPDMIIKKLTKILEKEKNRTATLLKNVSEIKEKIGVNDVKASDENNSVLSRKLRDIDEKDLPLCPEQSPHLLGPLYVKQTGIPDLQPETTPFFEHFGVTLRSGGASKPTDCRARTKLAVIVAYRDRAEHLKIFLHHMHPIFQRQQIDYRIFVIEQTSTEKFNRGALMNIGFIEANKIDNYDCFVLHDVDLVPEDDRNIYECPSNGPKHMSVAVNKWKYRLQYLNYIGGVTTLSRKLYQDINGFANVFYGWGGEDDDFNHRIQGANLTVNRIPAHLARYFMLRHDATEANNNLKDVMTKSVKNELEEDGLSNLNYQVVKRENFPLYTWILADLPPGPKPPPESFWSKMKKSLDNGIQYASKGLAEKVADQAIKYATQNEEKNMEEGDTIY